MQHRRIASRVLRFYILALSIQGSKVETFKDEKFCFSTYMYIYEHIYVYIYLQYLFSVNLRPFWMESRDGCFGSIISQIAQHSFQIAVFNLPSLYSFSFPSFFRLDCTSNMAMRAEGIVMKQQSLTCLYFHIFPTNYYFIIFSLNTILSLLDSLLYVLLWIRAWHLLCPDAGSSVLGDFLSVSIDIL